MGGPRGRSAGEVILDGSHMEPNSGCWLWAKSDNGYGYGHLTFRTKRHAAHRLSFSFFVRPLKKTEVLRHKCDNPACVNPVHLIPGTYKDNSKDAVERKRFPQQRKTHCVNGHNLSEAKWIKRSDGRMRRHCLYCHRENSRKYFENKKNGR